MDLFGSPLVAVFSMVAITLVLLVALSLTLWSRKRQRTSFQMPGTAFHSAAVKLPKVLEPADALARPPSQPASIPPSIPPVGPKTDNARLYTRRQLTTAEGRFYDFLRDTVNGRYLIETKTPLRDVFKRYGWLERDLYRMHRYGHLDFVLLEPILKNPILAIELDGSNHLSPEQQDRDRRKEELCRRANLKLLRFRVGKLWGEEERKLILDALPQ